MGTTAYIANHGNSLYQCTIDSATGVFSACSITNGAVNFYLHGMAVYGQWLYVASGLNAPIGLAGSANKVTMRLARVARPPIALPPRRP